MTIQIRDTESAIILKSISTDGVIDHIPPSVYGVSFNPVSGEIILNKDRKSFNTPELIFGRVKKILPIISEDIKKNRTSLGILLTGRKGSGKSLLAELLANFSLSMDLPVFYIQEAVPTNLLKLVVEIAGPCLVYIDEFEKLYPVGKDADGDPTKDTGEQGSFLSFFSDTSHKGVTFVLTANHESHLADYMIDRPQRFKYRVRHSGLNALEVQEVCDHYGITGWRRQIMFNEAVRSSGSFDTILHLAEIVKKCESLDSFNEFIEIYNLSHPMMWSLDLDREQRFMIDGRPMNGLFKIDQRTSNVLVYSREVGEQRKVLLDIPKKVLLEQANQNHGDTLVYAQGNISLKFSIKVIDTMQSHYFKIISVTDTTVAITDGYVDDDTSAYIEMFKKADEVEQEAKKTTKADQGDPDNKPGKIMTGVRRIAPGLMQSPEGMGYFNALITPSSPDVI